MAGVSKALRVSMLGEVRRPPRSFESTKEFPRLPQVGESARPISDVQLPDMNGPELIV
jgi:hypothetical protein